ncbi:MAG: hypothetical protein ACKO7A_21285 [Microcystis sp.]
MIEKPQMARLAKACERVKLKLYLVEAEKVEGSPVSDTPPPATFRAKSLWQDVQYFPVAPVQPVGGVEERNGE